MAKKLTMAEKLRRHMRKHPDGSPAAVAEKFGAHVAQVYKARQQVADAESSPPPKRKKAAAPQSRRFTDAEIAASAVSTPPDSAEKLITELMTINRIGVERVARLLGIIQEMG
jgi:hypothetical protein